MAQVSGYRFFALSLLLLLAFQVWGAQGRGNITPVIPHLILLFSVLDGDRPF